MKWASRLLWLWLLHVLLDVAPAWADGVVELRAGEFVLDARPRPPGADARWRSQALPDAWHVNHAGAARQQDAQGWYRFRFRMPDGFDPLQSVYLPHLGLNAAVYLNDRLVGDGGPFSEPYGRNWNRPLLFLLPPGLLRPGENVVHVRLLSHPYTQASLSPLLVGPDKVLRPRFEQAAFMRITLNQAASLLIASMGVLMLSLWWQRRQDVAYGYFGLSALIWAAQSTNLYLVQAPLPTAEWEILVNSSFQVLSGFLLISLLRFSGAGGRPLIPFLWLSVFASPVTQALAPAELYLTFTAFWHVYTLLCALATLLFLSRAALRWHNRDAGLIALSMGIVVLLAAHDWLMHSQHFWVSHSRDFFEDVFLLHYSAPLVFLAVGLIMTNRFVHVLNEFEALNSDLEARVQAKHVQLQSTFDRMRDMERSRAAADERERIYRDLHDDVGAKLLSLVYRAGTPEVADLARSALQDLRDVVSTTQPENLALEAACADWRAECEQRLREAGIGLDWVQRGRLDGLQLTQPQALNLGRILREAVSNVIKHARAAHARILVDADASGLLLEVRDDGIGCQGTGNGPSGRGVRNMVMRAGRIGAEFSRHRPATGGCEIRLLLPWGPSQTAQA